MTAFSSIKLQPEFLYVSASNDCNFLSSLNIKPVNGQYEAGIYGDIKKSSLKIKDKRIYHVNSRFKDNEGNVIEKITDAKDRIAQVESSAEEAYNDLAGQSYSDDTLQTFRIMTNGLKYSANKTISESEGVISASNDSFSFKVEKLDFDYVIDSKYFQKKSAIKNTIRHYKEEIIENNFTDLEWGYTNYNSLNFFSIDDTFNSNFDNDITHKNCLIYPNISNENIQTYNTSNIKDFSVSFYINPRHKNKQGFHFNPGCVINIPGILSVFLVKGSSFDKDGLTDSFRLYMQFGDETYESLGSPGHFLDIDDLDSQLSGLKYLTKDNILNYNHWHNVVISISKNEVTTQAFNASLIVDGVTIENIFIENNISGVSGNSFITLGNKFNVKSVDVQDFVLHAFSKDNLSIDDNEGAYVNKHILLGDQIDSVLNSPSDVNNTYSFLNSLNVDTNSYVNLTTSMALHAELCDVRIYNSFIDEDKAKNILAYSVKDIDNEVADFDLAFYLPVYYRSQNVRKKGLINLSSPYQKTITTGYTGNSPVYAFVNVNENLNGTYPVDTLPQENWPESESEFKIKTENISYNFSVNPYFYNYTGGTDVSVEHFTREFVKNTQPNIVVGGSLKEDRYQDCFLVKTSKILGDDNSELNTIAKSGGTSDDILFAIMKEGFLTSSDIGTLPIDYQSNNILYRNYMILPNDNGLQHQYYSNDVFKYNLESDDLNVHKNSVNEIDYSFVSLQYIDKSLSRTNSFNQNLNIIEDYFDREGRVTVGSESRKDCYFENEDYNNFLLGVSSYSDAYENMPLLYNDLRFKETPDKLKNISLFNFNDDYPVLYVNDLDSTSIERISTWRNNSIDGRLSAALGKANGCYNTFSNPAQRSYYSSYESAISNTEIFDLKPLELDNNIAYKKITMPLWKTNKDQLENIVNVFCISTQLFNNSIERETFSIKDVELPLSCKLSLSFADTKLGTLYRNDCLSKVAKWSTFGNVIYKEGIVTTTHPGGAFFGKTNYQIDMRKNAYLNVYELNLPVHAGESNLSENNSYIQDLKLDASAFNSDENFVYITDIDLHDENLNKVATVKLAQPFAKKNSDNALFRIKMDF
jgi:hypothetical protein